MRFLDLAKIAGCLLVAAVCSQAQVRTAQNAAGLAGAGEANELTLGLGATATYDDNAFNSVQPSGQALFSAAPKVAWNISRSHWSSLLDYNALISRSTRYDFYSRTSQTFNTDFSYQFSKSLSFNLADSFIRSADPLYGGGQFSAPSAGIPNPSFLGTSTVRTSNFVSAEGDYRLDARSTVSLGGSYSLQRYSDTPNASFRDSNGVSGQASYRRQFSPRFNTGVSYDASKFTTPTAGFMTFSQRLLLNEEITLRQDMSLTLFAGPNHVNSSFPVSSNGTIGSLRTSNWTWSAGGTYSWVVSKMNMSASAIRQVSDGGGLVGARQLTSFRYSVSGKLPHKLSGSIYVGYNLNNLINLMQAGVSGKYGSAGASLTRNITRDLSASLRYDRMEQLLGIASDTPWIDRNRIAISLNYTFTHPLGR